MDCLWANSHFEFDDVDGRRCRCPKPNEGEPTACYQFIRAIDSCRAPAIDTQTKYGVWTIATQR